MEYGREDRSWISRVRRWGSRRVRRGAGSFLERDDVYVENAGNFMVPFAVVEAVHSQKVIFTRAQLDPRMQQAILRAHDAEVPGV
jgi:hypothetical protein